MTISLLPHVYSGNISVFFRNSILSTNRLPDLFCYPRRVEGYTYGGIDAYSSGTPRHSIEMSSGVNYVAGLS